ncbi:MAG: SUF system NifU family Fe-S cluster assembly protein [Ignavibacteriales bacterium]|nr:SUF system NifU family Fe-S cluster assembly protein [Ignavibacteriales bacterium]
MTALRELYQEVILDHNKSPRNYGRMENPDRKIDGYNPLCGDHFTLFVRLDGDIIKDISFDGAGCAISKASASVMSATVKGKTIAEAEGLFKQFHALVKGEIDASENLEELGRLAAFSGVSEYPARVKCATLAWHTLHTALTTTEHRTSTES